MLEGILTEGFIYGIMVLGVFITFRILNFADMTVDGSFPLGACILGVMLSKGAPFPAALLLACLGASAAGLITALIHTRLKIPDLLSGIITMTMLYSINLRVMSNRANLSLIKVPTLFSRITEWASAVIPGPWAIVIFCALTIVVIKIMLDLFFHTDLGLCLGALGANPQLIISQGMNPDVLKITGICLANGLFGIAGAYAAMYQGFSDVNFGTGMIVSGLASLMIGEFLVKSNHIGLLTFRAILGSILYRALMYLARNFGFYIRMTANDLKLITGLLIVICIVISKTGFLAGQRSKKKTLRDSAK
ncbi:MAG: ABC transporter permease [Treponema sp.]|jgi:putative ABC transport system permease protein|nr:ABC transporter permease [Treponema sp.]